MRFIETTAQMLCDTPDCGPAEKVPLGSVRECVGRQCPKCNAVMVTAETADAVEAQIAIIDLLNAMAGPQSGSAVAVGNLSVRTDTGGNVAAMNYRGRDR